ncbi:MAG: PAS domain-containing protein [Firmicutes bacterium]|nr:PAS domain-containing protein [Bacillota bacterium]
MANELLDRMSDAVILLDGEQRVRYINLAAERLMGWEPGECVGQACPQILRCQDVHGQRLSNCLGTACLLKGLPLPCDTLYIRDRFDRIVPVSISHTPLPDAFPETGGGVLMVLRDLTLPMQEEEELRQANRRLLRLAAQRRRRARQLQQLAMLLAQRPDLPFPTDEVLAIILRLLEATSVSWKLVETLSGLKESGLPPSAKEERKSQKDTAVQSNDAVPLGRSDPPFGVLQVTYPQPLTTDDERRPLLRQVGYMLSLALEDRLGFIRLQRLAVLQERQRISREMHDSAAQTIAFAQMRLGQLRRSAVETPEASARVLGEIDDALQETLLEMQRVAKQRPPHREDAQRTRLSAILHTLHQHAQRMGIRLDIDEVSKQLAGQLFLLPGASFELVPLLQEALANVKKHAGTEEAHLSLRREADHCRLTLKDDGTGFDPTKQSAGHFGLHTMQERADKLGAALTIESTQGKGTRVVLRLPVTE